MLIRTEVFRIFDGYLDCYNGLMSFYLKCSSLQDLFETRILDNELTVFLVIKIKS